MELYSFGEAHALLVLLITDYSSCHFIGDIAAHAQNRLIEATQEICHG